MRSTTVLLSMTLFALAACAPVMKPRVRPTYSDIQDALHSGLQDNRRLSGKGRYDVPSTVSEALLPGNLHTLPRVNAPTSHRFSITVKNVPANTFFMGLVKNTPYNMTVAPEVKGNISLDLKNVTIDEVLGTVSDLYGYDFRRTTTGYEVLRRPSALAFFILIT